MTSRVYTPEEVAEMLQCSTRSVYDLLRTGKMQGFRIGHLWRITDGAIQDYISCGGSRQIPTKRNKSITYIH